MHFSNLVRFVRLVVAAAALCPLMPAAGAGAKLELREGDKLQISLELPSDSHAPVGGRFVFRTPRTVCEGTLHQDRASTNLNLVLRYTLHEGNCRQNCAYELSEDLMRYRARCDGFGVLDQGRFDTNENPEAIAEMRTRVAALPQVPVNVMMREAVPKPNSNLERLLRFDGLNLVKPTEQAMSRGIEYVIAQGQIDPRMLYPSRISQQVPETVAGWHDVMGFAYRAGKQYSLMTTTMKQLSEKVSLLWVESMVDGPKQRLMAQLAISREPIFALVGLMGQGDEAAISHYRLLAQSMAEDPFVQSLFAAATLKRTADQELQLTRENKSIDWVKSWRVYAIQSILKSNDLFSADQVLLRVNSEAEANGAQESLEFLMADSRSRAPTNMHFATQGSSTSSPAERESARTCVQWREIRGAPKVWTDAYGAVRTDPGDVIGTECAAWSR